MRKVPLDPIWSEFCREFDFEVSIFCFPLGKELYKITFFPETQKKPRKPLDASRRDDSNGGFGIPIGRPVAWEIDFQCAVRGAPIQL